MILAVVKLMMNIIVVPNPLGSSFGGWRHPDAWRDTVMSFQKTLECARLAEKGKLDLLFLADTNGVKHLDNRELLEAVAPEDRPAVFEPVTLLTALSQHTSHIGLVATATTTYEEPYLIARKFGSLDHLSGGRAGWNIVTSADPEDALNFSYDEHVGRSTRYARAMEFVEVVKGLWDSWSGAAFTEDQQSGRYLDASKVHVLNYKGEHFTVRGPLNMKRPPQGYPVLFTAGQSEAGRELAAKHTDCMFAFAPMIETGKALMKDVKGRLKKYGRGTGDLKIIPRVTIFVDETEEKAGAFYKQLGDLIPTRLGVNYLSMHVGADLSGFDPDEAFPKLKAEEGLGMSTVRNEILEFALSRKLTIRETFQHVLPSHGGAVFKGSPTQVADQMEEWYVEGACDGFMASTPVAPRGLKNLVDLVIPELQRRGLFRTDYPEGNLRNIMGLPEPQNQFFPSSVAS
jgi:FMN-dependent oxidoreductase (nitrilotriacetate monooxygenase family)